MVFGFKIHFVLNIAKAQSAGIEGVFVFVCGTGNHCVIKLSMFTHFHLIAAFTGEQSSLFLYGVKVAVDFVAAGAQVE
ncbi:hypothetical protein B5C26_13210 [Photorhabdus luminescens]|nr:hypothetical protein B5C26_13210 [Photorhabdus luminescens]